MALLTFSDANVSSQLRRFYRVKDLGYLISFEGAVVDSKSGAPVSGALVSSSVDSQTTRTDFAGRFYLQTRKPGSVIGFYTITVSATGYATKLVQGFFYTGNHLVGLVIPLST